MLRPIKLLHKGQEDSFACVHWNTFPPTAALIANHEEMSLDDYWRTGKLDTTKYQSAKVWERMCGKFKMDEGCIGCIHVRVLEIREMLPCLVTLDGMVAVPQVDIPTLEVVYRPPTITAHRKAKKP